VEPEHSIHAPWEETVPFDWVDLQEKEAEEQSCLIEQIAQEAQRSLNLQEGPLMRVVYFHLGEEKPDRLLWVIHHWVVDGVSWRILLEDLETAYRQAAQQKTIQLPAKTTSWKEWAQALQSYAKCEKVNEQMSYWRDVLQHVSPHLPFDHPQGANLQKWTRVVTHQLSTEETQRLLQETVQRYRTHIDELLITALALAISRWTKQRAFHLHLEGHGREEIDVPLDLSRTVGWFTNLYPVWVDLKESASAGTALREVKEQLRQVPQRGLGYGLLRYLQVDSPLPAEPNVPIGFNYLGQFAAGEGTESLFTGDASESPGIQMDPESIRPHVLDVNGFVIDGQLTITWLYSYQQFDESSIEKVAADFDRALRSFLTAEEDGDLWSYTPSDFPEADLSQKDLKKVLSLLQKKRKR
jgi:non-ribosomal peptide synthase protein (TIGR01720 family)